MPDNLDAPAEIALLQRPYEERERIAVVPDVKARVAKGAAKVGAAGAGVYVAGILTGPVGVGAVATGSAALMIRNRRKRKKWADLRILQVQRHEAMVLHFPENHPIERHLYIGNPVSPLEYYPAAAYQRSTLEHKAWEAAQLLMTLGATRLKVEGKATHSQELQEKLEGELGVSGSEIEVGASATNRGTSFVVYEYSLPAAEELPSYEQLAEELSWYSREKVFLNVAHARLDKYVDSLAFEVRHEDDRGINSSFEAKVRALGLDLGGSINDAEKQSMGFRMEATFT